MKFFQRIILRRFYFLNILLRRMLWKLEAFGEKKSDWEDDIEDILKVETFIEYFQLVENLRQDFKSEILVILILTITHKFFKFSNNLLDKLFFSRCLLKKLSKNY